MIPGDFSISIFVKNPVKGRVKTRIAVDVGDETALKIYLMLLERVKTLAKELSDWRVVVWYSDFIDSADKWPEGVVKKVQLGDNLGARMSHAIADEIQAGYVPIIVGSDIPDLNVSDIHDAAAQLGDSELVLGPSSDGGYYLIGTKKYHPQLFAGVPWSTDKVFDATIEIARNLGISYSKLRVLRDVDTFDDVKEMNLWSQ